MKIQRLVDAEVCLCALQAGNSVLIYSCTHHIICIYTYHIILCIHTYSTYAHTCTYTQDYSEKSDGRVTEEKLEACTDWGVPAQGYPSQLRIAKIHAKQELGDHHNSYFVSCQIYDHLIPYPYNIICVFQEHCSQHVHCDCVCRAFFRTVMESWAGPGNEAIY